VNRACFWLFLLAIVTTGCATGEGAGRVVSDRLYVKNCWNGTFDLRPTFFASDPFANTQLIRIQRG
jgi:predicted small secreted protein